MNIGHGILFIFLNYVYELFPDTKITKWVVMRASAKIILPVHSHDCVQFMIFVQIILELKPVYKNI